MIKRTLYLVALSLSIFRLCHESPPPEVRHQKYIDRHSMHVLRIDNAHPSCTLFNRPEGIPLRKIENDEFIIYDLGDGPYTVVCPDWSLDVWLISDQEFYLDCSACPDIIDLDEKVNSYRLCVQRWRLKTKWVTMMNATMPVKSVNCSSNWADLYLNQSDLKVNDTNGRLATGVATISCAVEDYRQAIYFTRSPNTVFSIETQTGSDYIWSGTKQYFYFHLAPAVILPARCVITTHASQVEFESFDTLNIAGGIHRVHCCVTDIGICGTVTKLVLDPSQCVVDCGYRIRITNAQSDLESKYEEMCTCKVFLKNPVEPITLKLPLQLACNEKEANEDVKSMSEAGRRDNHFYGKRVICSAPWSALNSSQWKMGIYEEDPPNHVLEVKTAQRSLYSMSDFPRDLSVCVGWKEMDSCDALATELLQPMCSVESLNIQNNQVNLICGSQRLSRPKMITVNLDFQSAVPITCVPSPLIVDEGTEVMVTLCTNERPNAQARKMLGMEIMCASDPDGLEIRDGVLNLTSSHIQWSVYNVYCGSDGKRVVIIVENPPNHVLEVKTAQRSLYSMSDFPRDLSVCVGWKEMDSCDALATELLQPMCSVESLNIQNNQVNLICGSQRLSRPKMITVNLDFQSAVPITCVPSPLIVDEGTEVMVTLCTNERPNAQARKMLGMEIMCASDPDGLEIRDGVLNLTSSHIQWSVYNVYCGSDGKRVVIIVENAPKRKMEIKIHPVPSHPLIKWAEKCRGCIGWTDAEGCDEMLSKEYDVLCKGVRYNDKSRKFYAHCLLPQIPDRERKFIVTIPREIQSPFVIDLMNRQENPIVCDDANITLFDFTLIRPRCNCVSEPGGLTFRDGSLDINESVVNYWNYSLNCVENGDRTRVYFFNASVRLISIPDQKYYIFGQRDKIVYQFEYPPQLQESIRQETNAKTECRIVRQGGQDQIDSGLIFEGAELTVGRLLSAESHRGLHTVECEQYGIRRTTVSNILATVDFRLEVLNPVKSTTSDQSNQTYTCMLRVYGINDLIEDDPGVHWKLDKNSTLQIVKQNQIRVGSDTTEMIHMPVCVFNYQGKAVASREKVVVTSGVRNDYDLIFYPPEMIIIEEDWHRVLVHAQRKGFDHRKSGNPSVSCRGTLTTSSGKVHDVSFRSPNVAYLTIETIPAGLLSVYCVIQRTSVQKNFTRAIIKRREMQINCVPHVAINLDTGKVKYEVCSLFQRIRQEWAKLLGSEEEIIETVECEGDGNLTIKHGSIFIVDRLPAKGSYLVTCPKVNRTVGVFVYNDALFLYREPVRSLYLFSRSQRITFNFAYFEGGVVKIQPTDPFPLKCSVVAPIYWDRLEEADPFVFSGTSLSLDLPPKYSRSADYRVDCHIFSGAVQRTIGVAITDLESLNLTITGSNKTILTGKPPTTFECHLTGGRLVEQSNEQDQVKWNPISGTTKIDGNKLIVDEKASYGPHVVACFYENGDKTKTKYHKFFVCRPGVDVWIEVHPEDQAIIIDSGSYVHAVMKYDEEGEIANRLQDKSVKCTLSYPKIGKTWEFSKWLKVKSLPPGCAVINCSAVAFDHWNVTNRTFVHKKDLTLTCIKNRAISLSEVTDEYLPICRYEIRKGVEVCNNGTTQFPANCRSKSRGVSFDYKTGGLNLKVASVGYHDISCAGKAFKGTFLIYDDTLQLEPEQKKYLWLFSDDGFDEIKFVFTYGKTADERAVLHVPDPVCSFVNHVSKQKYFTGLVLDLMWQQEDRKSMQYLVECSIHNGEVRRTTNVTIAREEDVKIIIYGPNVAVHSKANSYVYTCILEVTGLPDISTLKTALRFTQDEEKALRIHRNVLFVDIESEVGVHNVTCTDKYELVGLKRCAKKTIIVCDPNSQVVITIEPKLIIIDDNKPANVSAHMHWECTDDPYARKVTRELAVSCTVNYKSDSDTKVTFTNFVSTQKLKDGLASFNCKNEDSGHTEVVLRRIIDIDKFQIVCGNVSFINLADGKKEYLFCERILSRVEPYIKEFKGQKWPKLPVECKEKTGTLNFSEGTLILSDPLPPTGLYDVSCEGGNNWPVLLYNLDMKLTTIPKKVYWILGKEEKIKLAFYLGKNVNGSNVYLDEKLYQCEQYSGQRRRNLSKHVLSVNNENFGNLSMKHTFRCTVSGLRLDDQAIDVVVINPREIELEVVGGSHVRHLVGERFVYICQLKSPKVMNGLANLRWKIDRRIKGIRLLGATVVILPGVELGTHSLICELSENSLYSTVHQKIIVVARSYANSQASLNRHCPPKLYGPQELVEQVVCNISGAPSNTVIEWYRLQGNESFQFSSRTLPNLLESTVEFTDGDEVNGPSAFLCRARAKRFCRSALVVFARSALKTNLRILQKQRIRTFDEVMYCEHDLVVPEFVRYDLRLLLGDYEYMKRLSPNSVTWWGSEGSETRSYVSWKVSLIYMGTVYDSEEALVFSHWRNPIDVEFFPVKPIYRWYDTLNCRVMLDPEYNHAPYMMIEEYPRGFRPYVSYETIHFYEGFVGGIYTVACYFISGTTSLESTDMQFEFYENVSAIYIKKETSVKGNIRFGCYAKGYPIKKLTVDWIVIKGSQHAFTVRNDKLRLQLHAEYGEYSIACQAIVEHPDAVVRLNTTYNFTYDGDENITVVTDEVADMHFSSLIIANVCWGFFYVRFLYWITTLEGKKKKRSHKAKFLGEQQYMVLMDDSNIQRKTRSYVREIIRQYDAIQQIIQQIAEEKRHKAMAGRRRAEKSRTLKRNRLIGRRII
ncbi:unnamed protein product [Calicophoron daubneyi]|uniref:Uncharacterized protein n=1 Tax=Calicophoron daubneyi TaxID=300641 RepID=A0AAV2T9Z4_CALDB